MTKPLSGRMGANGATRHRSLQSRLVGMVTEGGARLACRYEKTQDRIRFKSPLNRFATLRESRTLLHFAARTRQHTSPGDGPHRRTVEDAQ